MPSSPVSNDSDNKSASHISTPDAEYLDANSTRSNVNSPEAEDGEGLDDDDEFDVSLGTARALYPFAGKLLSLLLLLLLLGVYCDRSIH